VVPEKPILPPPHGRSLEIPRGLRGQIFEQSKELNWNFHRGGAGGFKVKNLSWGLWIFSLATF